MAAIFLKIFPSKKFIYQVNQGFGIKGAGNISYEKNFSLILLNLTREFFKIPR